MTKTEKRILELLESVIERVYSLEEKLATDDELERRLELLEKGVCARPSNAGVAAYCSNPCAKRTGPC